MTTRTGPHVSADVAVVALTAEHWPAGRDIYAQGIATGHATFEAEPPSWEAFDAGRLVDHRLIAVRGDGRVLGWAAVSPTSARAVYAGVVEYSVCVAAEGRGQGIGRLLMNELIASTEGAGIWMLQAGVFPENVGSLRLHEAVGFRRVGIRDRIARMTYGPLAGQWRSTVLLERRSAVSGT
jgi:phosphinothricin acetyltransferase